MLQKLFNDLKKPTDSTIDKQFKAGIRLYLRE